MNLKFMSNGTLTWSRSATEIFLSFRLKKVKKFRYNAAERKITL